MTQVPPSRYSSATMTLAPCSAAIRAARTPPDPPPMTKRSTSCSAMLNIVSALFHFRAHFIGDLLGKLIGPAAGHCHAFVHGLRLFVDGFLPEGRLIERQELLQLRFSEMACIDASGIIHEFIGSNAVLFDQ